MTLNSFLSIVNGAWAIMLTFFIVFLLHYLWTAIPRVQWRDWFGGHPGAAQVAVAILIADIGNWIVRGSVWIWRETGAVDPLPEWLIASIAFGACIGTWGMLCKLRVFSLERFGQLPWMVCAGITVLFVGWKLA